MPCEQNGHAEATPTPPFVQTNGDCTMSSSVCAGAEAESEREKNESEPEVVAKDKAVSMATQISEEEVEETDPLQSP